MCMYFTRKFTLNKAVIDRRLRPGVAAWEVTLSTRKVVPCVRCPATGRPMTAHIYSQAQGCVCIALQLGGDVEQPWLTSKYDVICVNRKYITYS